MIALQDVESEVVESLKELNTILPPGHAVDLAPGSIVAGAGSNLDSMGIVNLVVILEERIHETFGIAISLMGTNGFLHASGPALDVRAISKRVLELLSRKSDSVEGGG